jgi:hypothetical protein
MNPRGDPYREKDVSSYMGLYIYILVTCHIYIEELIFQGLLAVTRAVTACDRGHRHS